MLKYILFEILIGIILGFFVFLFVKQYKKKNKFYSKAKGKLTGISEYTDTVREINKEKIKSLSILVGIISTAVVLLLVSALIFRSIFLNTHKHVYNKTIIKESTCLEEGIVNYKCKYCEMQYEEKLSVSNHCYSEKEHRLETCKEDGYVKYTCEICGNENTEVISVNSNHQYKIVSFSETSFWKNGYNHLSCELCGEQCYSLKVNSFNWICILAIIIIVVAVIIIISVASTKRSYESVIEKPWFWIATVFATLSIAFLLLHFVCVVPNRQEGGHWYDNYSNAPQNCELTEVGRSESTYTQNGTITYKDNANGTEYVEYLPKKEIVAKDIPQYSEKQYSDVSETPSNGSIKDATPVPLFSKVTGRLSNEDDKADYYSFTVAVPSNMHFVFTHDADTWSYHWNATIYGTDGETVLNDGYITNKEQVEFSVSDLQVGTYYLKITQATGGNPIMNNFSDANYYITFTPECIEHTSQTQYFTKVPTCTKSGEIVTVCDACGANISTEQVESLDHKWSEWNIIKEASILQLGEKDRTCTVCGEIQNKAILTYIWIAIFLIVSLIILLILHFVFNKYSEGYKGKIITTFIYDMIIFATVYFAIANYPLFGIITAIICIALLIKPMIDAKKDWEKGWMIFAIVIMILNLTIGGFFAANYIADKSDNTPSAIHTSAEEKVNGDIVESINNTTDANPTTDSKKIMSSSDKTKAKDNNEIPVSVTDNSSDTKTTETPKKKTESTQSKTEDNNTNSNPVKETPSTTQTPDTSNSKVDSTQSENPASSVSEPVIIPDIIVPEDPTSGHMAYVEDVYETP